MKKNIGTSVPDCVDSQADSSLSYSHIRFHATELYIRTFAG